GRGWETLASLGPGAGPPANRVGGRYLESQPTALEALARAREVSFPFSPNDCENGRYYLGPPILACPGSQVSNDLRACFHKMVAGRIALEGDPLCKRSPPIKGLLPRNQQDAAGSLIVLQRNAARALKIHLGIREQFLESR